MDAHRYSGWRHNATRFSIVLLAVCPLSGCRDDSAPSVRVYCSVDETFARAVFDRLEATTNLRVALITDSEAGKTTGLVNKIIAEAQRPRADVFWSGELFNTIRLAREGLLAPYDPPSAADIPKRYRDPQRRWTATAVRARVIAFDPAATPRDRLPARWEQLGETGFAKQTAIANPLFGTTLGHVAAMHALWGEQRFRSFIEGLKKNGALVVDGNSVTVRSVMSGRVALGCTDTDDVWVAQRAGATIDLVYPDMGDGGTLLVPCSVAMVRGGPNATGARRVIDFLASQEVERMLAQSDSRNVPVRPALRSELGLTLPPETKIPFDQIADSLDEAASTVRAILLR